MRQAFTSVPAAPMGGLPSRGVLFAGLVFTILLSLAYAFGVVVPYYVNDLDAFPLAEVAGGAHDPKDLWPLASGFGGGTLYLVGVFAIVLVILVQVPIAIAALVHLVSHRSEGLRSLWPNVFIVIIATALLAVQLSPFGRALSSWVLD